MKRKLKGAIKRKIKNPVLIPACSILLSAVLLLSLSSALQSLQADLDQDARDHIMSYLLLGGAPFKEEPYSGEDDTITAVYRGNGGYVIETTVDGYADDIVLWVGVKNGGYVSGLTVRDMDETYGLGRKAMHDADFLLQFLRSEGDDAVGETVDAITGATVTSKAVTKGVNAAVAFVTGADVSSGATEWGG